MTEAEELKAIEAKLKTRRVTRRDFQVKARVSASTWYRIREAIVVPNGATMRRVRDAMADIEKGDAKGKKDSAE